MTPAADANARLGPGDLVTAVFPRMAGKARPGLVAEAIYDAAGARVTAVIAAPLTSRRTHQAGRLALAGCAALPRASQAIPPLAAALPASALLARLGSVDAATCAALEAALIHWFGPNWRRTEPPLEAGLARPRLLHPLSPAARRAAARAAAGGCP